MINRYALNQIIYGQERRSRICWICVIRGGAAIPYIKIDDRGRARGLPLTAGELNYAITELLIGYVQAKTLSYQTINDISGACTEALAEFRRRVVVKYEDGKIAENGEVYPEWLL